LSSLNRDYVERENKDVLVYSGTHGVCELKDINGDLVEIWLYPQEGRLPVPR
jgi:hypothetical protein